MLLHSGEDLNMSHKWSLYYFPERIQIDELTFGQVKLLIKTFPASEFKHWMVWVEEHQIWKSLGENLEQAEETTNVGGSGAIAPAPPRTKPEDEMQEAEEHEEPSTSGASTALKNRRLTTRFSKRYQVFAEVHGKVVSNRTIDISASGMRLEHGFALKDKKPFIVTLVKDRDKSTIVMICEPAGQGPTYTSLKITKLAKKDLFHAWLSEEEK